MRHTQESDNQIVDSDFVKVWQFCKFVRPPWVLIKLAVDVSTWQVLLQPSNEQTTAGSLSQRKLTILLYTLDG